MTDLDVGLQSRKLAVGPDSSSLNLLGCATTLQVRLDEQLPLPCAQPPQTSKDVWMLDVAKGHCLGIRSRLGEKPQGHPSYTITHPAWELPLRNYAPHFI